LVNPYLHPLQADIISLIGRTHSTKEVTWPSTPKNQRQARLSTAQGRTEGSGKGIHPLRAFCVENGLGKIELTRDMRDVPFWYATIYSLVLTNSN
jgi:hypothetical protein